MHPKLNKYFHQEFLTGINFCSEQKLEEKLKADFDEDLANSGTAYAQIFANEGGQFIRICLWKRDGTFRFVLDMVVKRQNLLWIKAKRLFLRVGTAEKKVISKVKQKIEDFEERKVELDH